MVMDAPHRRLHQPVLPPTLPEGTRLYASTGWFTNTNTLEFFVAAMALVWGLWALGWIALDEHPTISIKDIHVTHAEKVPLWVIGSLGASVGAAHLLTVMQSVRLRMVWLFGEIMWWAALGFMVLIAVPSSAAVVMYGGLCVVVAICYLRLYIVHGELFTLRSFFAPVLRWCGR